MTATTLSYVCLGGVALALVFYGSSFSLYLPGAPLRMGLNLCQALLVHVVKGKEACRGIRVQGLEFLKVDCPVTVHVEVPQEALDLM